MEWMEERGRTSRAGWPEAYTDTAKARLDGERRKIAQLSAQHPLTGYDHNVLNQWLDAGAPGRRPELSFEIEAQREAAAERIRQQREAEVREFARAAAEREQFRQEREARAAAMAQWRLENPERAALRDERQRRRIARQQREAEDARRLMEVVSALEANRTRIRKLIAGGGFQAVLGLSSDDWKVWSEEIASADQLDAFTEQCAKRKPERPKGFFQHLAGVFGFD